MSKLSKKKVIGITGSMGSGKSEISRFIKKGKFGLSEIK